MEKESLAYNIFTVRYHCKENVFLEEYIERFDPSKEALLDLLILLKEQVEKPLLWNKYLISEALGTNTKFFKKQLLVMIDLLLRKILYM